MVVDGHGCELMFSSHCLMFCAQLWPVQADPDQDEEIHLFFARGQRWKRLRSAVNAGFTAAKLRKVRGHLVKYARRHTYRICNLCCELMQLFRKLYYRQSLISSADAEPDESLCRQTCGSCRSNHRGKRRLSG